MSQRVSTGERNKDLKLTGVWKRTGKTDLLPVRQTHIFTMATNTVHFALLKQVPTFVIAQVFSGSRKNAMGCLILERNIKSCM